jgi:hypothetical protein
MFLFKRRSVKFWAWLLTVNIAAGLIFLCVSGTASILEAPILYYKMATSFDKVAELDTSGLRLFMSISTLLTALVCFKLMMRGVFEMHKRTEMSLR